MSNSMSGGSKSGIGFTGLLLIAFIVLKLSNIIDWNWWWVLAPAWIGAAIFIGLFILFVIVPLIFLSK